MKKLLLVLLSALLCTGLFSQIQQIKIVSFTVKNKLPAVIDNWTNVPGSLLLVAQIPPGIRINGIRLVLQIRANGAVICSNNTTGGMQVDNFTTRTFSASELIGAFSGCHDLKDGNYTICAQFFNIDRKEISNEVCKEFTVETPKETDYAPPTLITPDNGKGFTEAELSRPVSFRWTPLVPKPRDPVTYRIKVWQLMQGQNGTQAMRSNQPIVTKDVDNITQAVVNGIYTGPCKPPYLCDYIWQVQAMNKDGKPMGRNNGNSEPYTFKVENKETESSPPKLVSPENGKEFAPRDMTSRAMFRWTAIVPKPQEPVTYRIKVWQLMEGQNATQAMRSNQPIVTKDVDNITQTEISNLYTGPCRPPYLCDFMWEVQALNREGKPFGKNEGKSEAWSFNVKESASTSMLENVFPEDKKRFSINDAKKPIIFRWTALVPKPRDPVTYRLKVWQLMQGQNATQAMRENKPVVTKEVENITEATVSNLYTGPCKPPYLCDYIWNVEAITRQAGTVPKVVGSSSPTSFKILDDNINTKIDSVSIGCCINGKQNIYVKINNLHPTNLAQVTAIKYRVNGTGPLTTLSPTVPATPFTIAANSTQAFTASINCVDSMKTIKFIVDAIWPTDPDNINNETAWDTLHCACDACDEKHFTLNVPSPQNINYSNNTLTFNQSITITTTPPKTIKSIKAELVYFEMVPENDMCIPCNKDAATYGHFTNGSNSQQWNGPQQNLNISITTPQLTPCCSAVFKWCIRYKIEFTDCTTCNKLVCYEKKKAGCEKAGGGIDNPNNPK